MRTLIIALLVLSPSLAEACKSCGRYGSSCRYYKTTYVPYAKPVYVPPAQTAVNVLLTNITNPAPIGQGNTIYRSTGYQQASITLFDRNAHLHGVNEIARGLVSGVTGIMARADASAQLFASQDAPAIDALARAQAAETTLNALGLNVTNAQGSVQSSGIIVQRDARGQWQALPLDQYQMEQVRSQVNGYAGNGQPNGPVQQPGYALLGQFCYRCHGLSVPNPPKGVRIGPDAGVAQEMRQRWFEITSAVGGAPPNAQFPNGVPPTMPPNDAAQPTKEQRQGIINEMQAIIKTYANGNGYVPQVQPAPPVQQLPPQPLPPPPTPAT